MIRLCYIDGSAREREREKRERERAREREKSFALRLLMGEKAEKKRQHLKYSQVASGQALAEVELID